MHKNQRAIIDAELVCSRELLENNERVLRRRIRCVMQKDTPESEAIMNLAGGKKFGWTPQEWKKITDHLDNCDLTVGEWLSRRNDD